MLMIVVGCWVFLPEAVVYLWLLEGGNSYSYLGGMTSILRHDMTSEVQIQIVWLSE